MNAVNQSLLAFAVIVAASLYAQGSGWLGPYGMPGDNLHLILLVSVLFFTYLIFFYTVLRHLEAED